MFIIHIFINILFYFLRATKKANVPLVILCLAQHKDSLHKDNMFKPLTSKSDGGKSLRWWQKVSLA